MLGFCQFGFCEKQVGDADHKNTDDLNLGVVVIAPKEHEKSWDRKNNPGGGLAKPVAENKDNGNKNGSLNQHNKIGADAETGKKI